MSILNVGTAGCDDWIYISMDPLLKRTFPNTRIVHDRTRPYDLVIRSHSGRPVPNYSCPYITWSGEPFRVPHYPDRPPILEINTAHFPEVDNTLYLPYLVVDVHRTERPTDIKPKRWCASYAFTHHVGERESLFTNLRLREPTCYAFGPSCRTRDNPFELVRNERHKNSTMFSEFGFIVAMENRVLPGYVTEKIGHAFNAGAVPIYWGDTNSVNEFFNPAAFINFSDYPNAAKAADTIVNIWRDKQKLQKYLDAPVVLNNTLRDYEAVYTEYRPWQAPFVNALRDTFPDLN